MRAGTSVEELREPFPMDWSSLCEECWGWAVICGWSALNICTSSPCEQCAPEYRCETKAQLNSVALIERDVEISREGRQVSVSCFGL